MPITEAAIKEQLPPDAQISRGNTKLPAGVIDESLYGDDDVLANQARRAARIRGGVAYDAGANFPDDLINRTVLRTPKEMINRSMSAETINALVDGQINRDQQYVGNNADWTGYYLEPFAKYVQPFSTPFRNMLPRTPAPGIDVINWRAITSLFNGVGPSVGAFILQQQNSTGPQEQQYVWVNQSNLLRTLARKDVITDESEIYARMFEPDMRAKVAAKLAPSLMLGQEVWYLNGAQKMWSPAPGNGISQAASGGTLSNATYWIIVTAYNANGETLAYSLPPFTATVPGAASITLNGGGSSQTLSFNLMRIPNAISGGSTATGGWSYNVYIGTGSTQPANSAMWLQTASLWVNNSYPAQLTTHVLDDPGGYAQGWMNVTLTGALATSGTAYSTVVTAGNTAITYKSTNAPANQALVFDGIQSLVNLNAGTPSTAGEGGENTIVRRVADANGILGKTDLDGWLESLYFNAQANPEALLCGIKDHKALSYIVMNSTNFRVNTEPSQAGLSDLAGGGRATKWINQTTGRLMDIIMCPYLQQGSMVAVSLTLPFPVAEIVEAPLRIGVNREMWAREYPPDQNNMTQWAYASFVNETLIAQYLGGQSVLTGIVTA